MPAADEDLIARANARVGALLKGKYTLDRVVGIGGMATVYAATHRNGKEFAIKVLHADLSLRSDTRTRFLREGYLANRVSHPGAVAVLDDDIGEDGAAFLVMELIAGQTVEAIWERQRGRLPLQVVAGIGLQLLDVLAAAHARGLIHRDIKPGNLMVTHDGAVKVLDFGIARLRDVANAHTTQTGMVMGTPAFMAPEHALAKTDEIDAQTDLWAAGATMFTLATGMLVHEADNTQQLLVRAATAPARLLASVMSGAPAAICTVVDRALQFEKSARWSDATAMQNALREAARESFDRVPTQGVLADLLDDLVEHEHTNILGATDPPPANDAAAEGQGPDPSELVTGRGPVARPHPAVDTQMGMAPAPDKARSPAPPPAIALITAAAVATDSALRRTTSRPRGVVAAGAVAGAFGVAAVLLAITRGPSTKEAGLTGSATRPSTDATGAAPPHDLTPPVSSITAPAAWTAIPLTPAVPGKPANAPPQVGTGAPRPRPVGGPPPAAVAPAAAVPAAPPKPNCNPPYEFDGDGNKRWKRECL
jgi:serine/threonine-protein kinase